MCVQKKQNCDLWDKDPSNSHDHKKRQPMLYRALYCQATVFAGFGELQIVFWDRLSLSSPSWPQPRDPLLLASQVMGLQICVVIPGPYMNIWLVIFPICDKLMGGPSTVSKKQNKNLHFHFLLPHLFQFCLLALTTRWNNTHSIFLHMPPHHLKLTPREKELRPAPILLQPQVAGVCLLIEYWSEEPF